MRPHRRRVAGELQLPRPDRRSPAQSPSVDECCSEAEREGARRTVKLRVSGAFHSPLVARAAERLRPALDRAKFTDPIAPFMSTVTAKIEPAQRMAALLVEQLTAPVKFTQAARELMRQGVKVFVEVGPGQRADRFTEEDRPQREGDPGQRPRLAREVAGDASKLPDGFCSLEGKTALVTGGSRGIGRAIALELGTGGRRGRRRLPLRRRRGRGGGQGGRRPRRPGRRLRPGARPGASSRRPATSTSSSTTRA